MYDHGSGVYTVSTAAIRFFYRGSGVGQKLYDMAIQEVKKQGGRFLTSCEQMTDDANGAWKRLSKRYPVTHQPPTSDDEGELLDADASDSWGKYTLDLSKIAAKAAKKQAGVNSAQGAVMDWSGCAEVERIPGKVSGAPILKNSRVFADSIVENYEDGETAESLADMFNVPVEQVRTVLDYALSY